MLVNFVEMQGTQDRLFVVCNNYNFPFERNGVLLEELGLDGFIDKVIPELHCHP